MPVDPKDFFKLYVLAPYAAWCEDELCEWKALATPRRFLAASI